MSDWSDTDTSYLDKIEEEDWDADEDYENWKRENNESD